MEINFVVEKVKMVTPNKGGQVFHIDFETICMTLYCLMKSLYCRSCLAYLLSALCPIYIKLLIGGSFSVCWSFLVVDSFPIYFRASLICCLSEHVC